MNIAEIESELQSLTKDPFVPSEFIYRLIEIYHAPKATITKLKQGTQNKADMAGDLLWRTKLYYRTAEKGATAITMQDLAERKLTKTNKVRIVLVTDGIDVSALDTKSGVTLHCAYTELNDHFTFFLPLANVETYQAIEENKADIKAANRLSKFHDEIIRQNPDWATEEKRHQLNLFMTRVLFCMFAEDTGIFKANIFTKIISDFGGEHGGQLQFALKPIFDIMNVKPEDRGDKPKHVLDFPYVNGGLFEQQTDVPKFNKRAMNYLLDAAQLDWRDINPDIFGSMIQAVVDVEMRGDLGMHYTSVPNIMKVLGPLFLVSLEEQFVAAGDNANKLNKLRTRISKIRVFDPACGSGNFLIIAYRELRKLEMRVIEKLRATQREPEMAFSDVPLSNFFGIEYADFAAETAKLSLWIAEYQMNVRFGDTFGNAPPPLPLKEGGNIHHGNALRLDWLEVCPPHMKRGGGEVDDEVETYIVGNPPYYGRQKRTIEQREDMTLVFADTIKKYKNMDYVTAWYFLGAKYAEKVRAEFAFVATNSICQGEHVSLLWPQLFQFGLEISFAHQSFKWTNLAKSNAGVTCVIVGVRRLSNDPKYLFDGDMSRKVKTISPYLIDMPTVIVTKASKPQNELPQMQFGNMAYDQGNLILSPAEKLDLTAEFPQATKLIRRLVGSQEFVKGVERYCLWIHNEDLPLALSIPPIANRISRVRSIRLASSDSGGVKLAKQPHQFREMNEPKEHTIVVPSVTSSNRPYVQAGVLGNNCIVSNLAFAIFDAPIFILSLLSSTLHIAWIKAVCGKLKTDYRYSNTIGYNTFPIPPLTDSHKELLEFHAWEIIKAREANIGKTIAQLYDPDKMPDNLRAAHRSLDNALETIYIGRPFRNDTERLEHLFKLYAKMTAKEESKSNA